jgi:hypothetical protein
MKARITAILEIIDNGEYCSDVKVFILNSIPEEMENSINQDDYIEWIKFLPGIDNKDGSGELDKQEYKYTIMLVEVAKEF